MFDIEIKNQEIINKIFINSDKVKYYIKNILKPIDLNNISYYHIFKEIYINNVLNRAYYQCQQIEALRFLI